MIKAVDRSGDEKGEENEKSENELDDEIFKLLYNG